MPSPDNAYLRHQQMRWLRCDAARWVRPDAARWLKPGTRPEDINPALALKYNSSQPRVPAGNPDGGQWTSGDGGSGRPRVIIDTTDLDHPTTPDVRNEVDALNLFSIRPDDRKPDGVQLAGDPPRGMGDNGGPPLKPEIPEELPATTDERMKFVRDAIRWIAHVGRASPMAQAFFGAAEEIEEITRLTDMIRTGNDPAPTLDAARVRAFDRPSENGYHDHHIFGQHDQNKAQFGKTKIESYENKVRIPILNI